MARTPLMNSFLEDNPFLAYTSKLPNTGLSDIQKSWLGQYYFPETQQKYQEQLGQETQTGTLPTTQYIDWLDQYMNPDRMLNAYYGATPYQRGSRQSSLKPMARYLFY